MAAEDYVPIDEWCFDNLYDYRYGDPTSTPEYEREERPAVAYQNGNSNGGKKKYEHKENRGSMFENDQKSSEKHPDFTGSINVHGTVYWISGWKEMTGSGKKKLSLSVKEQDQRPQAQQGSQQPQRQAKGW